jgi:hypothetical protein
LRIEEDLGDVATYPGKSVFYNLKRWSVRYYLAYAYHHLLDAGIAHCNPIPALVR